MFVRAILVVVCSLFCVHHDLQFVFRVLSLVEIMSQRFVVVVAHVFGVVVLIVAVVLFFVADD